MKSLLIFLILLIASLQKAEANSFGRTAGQYSTSPAGSAQYSIPIWNPPGIHGLQPGLALSYDSQMGYGLMGPGWTIAGMSAISRCNPTYAQDAAPAPITLTMADVFCLDGNRLRLTSSETLSTYGEPGTTYQTEIANFSNVTAEGTAGNGPSYFTVQGNNGLTYEYGNTTDSKVLAPGGSTPYIWALDKVTDSSGNTMEFVYLQSGGAYVPSSIKYTAPSGSSTYPYQINFAYTTKSASDTLTKYIAAAQIQQTEQLSTITVTSSGTTVREYKLLYTTSTDTLRATLTSIQECGGSAGTDCLPATTIGYQSGTAGVVSPTTATGSGATNGTVYSVDINGDGKQDLVFAVTSGSNYQWWVQLATATGYGSPINTGAVTVGTTNFMLDDFDAKGGTEILAPVSGVWYAYRWNGTSFTATTTGVSVVAGALYSSADVDGDGRPDLISVTPYAVGGSVPAGTANVGIQLNTSSGSISFVGTPVVHNVSVLTGSAYSYSNMQVFGDNQLQNSSIKRLDFDGDGRQDLLIYYWGVTLFNGKPTIYPFLTPLLARGAAAPVLGTGLLGLAGVSASFGIANWNDDACTDLYLGTALEISPCNGSLGALLTLPAIPSLALDWDGDGRTDLLANVSGVWQLYRSEGDAIAPAVSTGIAVGTGKYLVTDQNGDGLDDLLFANPSASNAVYFGLHNGAGQPPDLLNSVVDGYGNSAKPTYVSITQSNYSPATDATFPYQNFIGPLYVVSEAIFNDTSNMPSGTYNKQYYYSSAWTNLQGRGFQSFFSTQTLDSRNGVYDYQYYQRSFPYSGMKYQEVLATATTNFNVATGTPAVTNLDTTPNNQRVFPYFSNWMGYQYEVGGAENADLITTTSTNYSYDNFGNATTVATTTTDNDPGSPYFNDTWSSTTVSTITPNTSTWCLNLPTETQVTDSSTAPGGTAMTRTVSYSPDYSHCRQSQRVIEPSSSTYKVTEAYGYDGFGNLSTDTVTGVGMAARTTTTSWGTTGQFPATITNPLGQSVALAFDPNSGRQTSQTDPNWTTSNPIITSWGYDDFARKTSESRADGTSTTWSYNACAPSCVNTNNQMTVTKTVLNVGGSTQSVTNVYADALDRTLVTSSTMVNGQYDRNEVQYNSLGLVKQQGVPCFFSSCTNYWTTYTYDVLNRLVQSQRPISATNGTLQTTSFGYQGRTTTVTDAKSNTNTRITLVTGNLARTQDPSGYYINFTYDAFGSLLSTTDSLSNALSTMTYGYGLGAFRQTLNDTDLGARTYTIDALGEVTAMTDAKAQSFQYYYDALSRPTSRTEPDLTTTWTWGNTASSYNIGKLQSVASVDSIGTRSESYGYDSKTRLSTRSITIPADASYTYTSTYSATTGLLDTFQYPVSTSSYQMKLQYSYINGIVSQISDVSTGVHYWTANNVNPRGQLTQETLGNGVVVNHAFDAVTGWVGSIQAGAGGGSTLQNNAYLFDEVGNLSQRQDFNSGVTESVYPDNLNRLGYTVGDSNTHMVYDTMGRISTWTQYGAATNVNDFTTPQSGCTYYANSQLHALRKTTAGAQPPTSFCYDANGNMTKVSVSGSAVGGMSWTSYNQPSAIAAGTTSGQLYYDADHQRYKQVASYSGSPETTTYVGGLLEKVANSAGTGYRHYIPAGNIFIDYIRLSTGSNSTFYVTKDQIGSSAVITDSTGTLIVKETFGALGAIENSAGDQATIATISRHEFTGQELMDNTGILFTNMNGRVYTPSGSMFISPDPYISAPGNTQNYNRYGYVYNNPLTNTDPTGYFSWGNLLNPFSNSNPLNPFGSFGRKLALAPFTTLYDSYRFATRTSDNLLRDERWLQPIAEIAACYYGGPYACAAASAKLTRLNGGTMDQALIAGALTYASGDLQTNSGSLISDAVLNGAVGGLDSSLTGGNFWRGFAFAAAGSIATDAWTDYVGTQPGAGPGQSYPTVGVACADPVSNCYIATLTDSQNIPDQDLAKNTFGFNQQLTGDGSDGWSQSGKYSIIADQIPGMQAISQFHDTWMNALLYPSTFSNFASMPFVAIGTYGTLLGGSYYFVPMLNVNHHR